MLPHFGVHADGGEPRNSVDFVDVNLAGRPLAEGAATAGIAASEAKRLGLEAPIINATAAILVGELTIGEAVKSLLSRPLKSEDA